MVIKCPKCGLFNPETARRCDCGYNFEQAKVETPLVGQPGRTHKAPVAESPWSEVTVVDVRMPFASMVAFMVKWAIASIPALIILLMLGLLVSAVLGGIFAGLLRGLR